MGLAGRESLALWRFLPDADIADFLAEHEGSSHQQRTLLPTIVDQTLEFKIFNQPRVWDSLAAVPGGYVEVLP